MTLEDPVLQVWTFFLKKGRIIYDKWALLALIVWCESHRFDGTKGTMLDSKTLECAGRCILAAASMGDEAVLDAIKPWRFIVDLLKQLKNERDPRMVVGDAAGTTH